MQYGSPVAHPAVMMRRDVVRSVGGYRPAFPHAEDYDLWLRISETQKIANIPQFVLRYRLHSGSVSTRHLEAQALTALTAKLCSVARRTGAPDRARNRKEPVDLAFLRGLSGDAITALPIWVLRVALGHKETSVSDMIRLEEAMIAAIDTPEASRSLQRDAAKLMIRCFRRHLMERSHFRPADGPQAERPFTFLVTGKIDAHLFYRIEAGLRGLAAERERGLDARLTLAGVISDQGAARWRALIDELGLDAAVDYTGPYSQEASPEVYRSADAYLMLKHNDPYPNTVIEGMACGLPVLYSASGGVPELVGSEAGIGLACDEDWERPRWPDAAAIADGMLAIVERRAAYAAAARRRAVDRFDLVARIVRHREVFVELLEVRS